ncbi:DUF6098 family protein [Georgenia sp. SYP-B2076]|uniref:DUF6098 family protein n=1 Tax=Georgenia sp. SYP-B2076 TaxID=2495881 RepID=UPI001F0C41D2|nr:DUF6098 family protein [Georgenia sp. SYP-B2076]
MSAQDIVDLGWLAGDSGAERHGPRLARTLGDVVAVQRELGEVFLRISGGPEADKTAGGWHRESGYPLPGLPAWPLHAETWWRAGQATWIARQLVQYSYLLSDDNRPWLLTGTVVGRGADCEPLLADVVPVAHVAPGVLSEAQSVYAGWRAREFR